MNENDYSMPAALTIAGSDSGGGAGIQADIKTFSANLVYASSVITAITAQNTVSVDLIHDIPPHIVDAQLKSVLSDIPIKSVKIGMLSNSNLIEVVAKNMCEFKVENIVLDPVMIAKSGDRLLKSSAIEALIDCIIPISTLVTPNIPELYAITGADNVSEEDRYLIVMAKEILKIGAKNVLVKGGHLSGNILTDTLIKDDGSEVRYSHKRINTNNTHGTGCTMSSAIAANLAKGFSVENAVRLSAYWLHGAIEANFKIGQGNSPVNHLYEWQHKSMK